MARKGTGEYPPGWPEYARTIKEQAGWKCVRCNHPHDPKAGYCLTVHHVTMAKDEPFEHWWAFLALCQRCHLQIQHKLVLERPWVMFPHSDWFKPYVAAYYALKYLGEELTQAQTMARLDELLALEVAHVLQGAA